MGTELVFNENGKALTSSVLVAKKFEKKHSHVLDVIRKILATAENSAVLGMFVKSQYINEQNKEQPMYIMNRDGFTLLAMGFTGKLAMQFKLDYINAFNQMEQTIKNPTPMSELEILARSAQALLEQSKRLDNVEYRLERIELEHKENKQLLLAAEISNEQLPEESESAKIRKLVHLYVKTTGMGYEDVWNAVYETLEYSYGNRIRAFKRLNTDKSLLDVAIRNNLGQKVFNVISDMVKSVTNKKE